MRPSLQSVVTRLREIFHFSAISDVVIKSIFSSKYSVITHAYIIFLRRNIFNILVACVLVEVLSTQPVQKAVLSTPDTQKVCLSTLIPIFSASSQCLCGKLSITQFPGRIPGISLYQALQGLFHFTFDINTTHCRSALRD